MIDRRYQALDLAIKAGDAARFDEFLALLTGNTPTLYRAPLRRINARDFARDVEGHGDTLIAVSWHDGDQRVSAGFYDWSAVDSALTEIQLGAEPTPNTTVYGIFERAPS